MTKLLLKAEIDMNDSDYVHGTCIVNKESWLSLKKHMIEKGISKSVFCHDIEREWEAEKFFSRFITEQDITDADVVILKKNGFR